MVRILKTRKPPAKKKYQSFWEATGEHFPAFFDAPSTSYYLEGEISLFQRYIPNLAGKRIFKTDLWDEAKNTRILKWAADQGAETYGIDISFPIVRVAQDLFLCGQKTGRFVVSDLRDLPFADRVFDDIYSMGTIEHFPEYEQALRECFRVMKPGGRAIVGVPNKLDPFFRPLLVSVLNSLGLYAYGFELSFAMGGLRRMLQKTGFRVIDETGILFLPGWLRMLDQLVAVRWPRLCFLTRPLIRPFALFFRKCPSLRRHGYLIACVVQRP